MPSPNSNPGNPLGRTTTTKSKDFLLLFHFPSLPFMYSSLLLLSYYYYYHHTTSTAAAAVYRTAPLGVCVFVYVLHTPPESVTRLHCTSISNPSLAVTRAAIYVYICVGRR